MNKMLLKLFFSCSIAVMITSDILASRMSFMPTLNNIITVSFKAGSILGARQPQQIQALDQQELKQVAKDVLLYLRMDGAFDQSIHATGPTLRQHIIKSHIIFNNSIPQKGDHNFYKSVIMSKDKNGDDVFLMIKEVIAGSEILNSINVSYFIAAGKRYLRVQVPAPKVVFYQRGRQIQDGYLNFCLIQGRIIDPLGDHSKDRWTYNLIPSTMFMSKAIKAYQHPGDIIGLDAASIQDYQKVEKRLVFEKYIVDQDKIKAIGVSNQQDALLNFFYTKDLEQMVQHQAVKETEEEKESSQDSEVKEFLELEKKLEPEFVIQEFEEAPKYINDQIKYPNGDVYQGEYKKNGQRSGEGKMTYADGSTYKGTWKDDLKDGYGYAEFLDANKQKITYTYRGYFKGGQMHRGDRKSKMTYYNNNGDVDKVYKGDWKHGNLKNGIIKYSNGGQYEGKLLDGQPHKTGKMAYPNGDTYEGEWQNGKPHGQGAYRSNNVIKEGLFFNGQFINDMQQQKNQWRDSYFLILSQADKKEILEEVKRYIQAINIYDEACIYVYVQASDTLFCVYSRNAAISAIDSLVARNGSYNLQRIISKFKTGSRLKPMEIELLMLNSYVKSDSTNELLELEQTIQKSTIEQLKIILEREDLDDYILYSIVVKCYRNYEILAKIVAHKNVGLLTLMWLAAHTSMSDIFMLIAQQYIEASYFGMAITVQMLQNNKFRSFDTYFKAIEAVVAKHATNNIFLESLIIYISYCYQEVCGGERERAIAPIFYAIASNPQVSAQTLKLLAEQCAIILPPCIFKYESFKCIFRSEKIQTSDQDAADIAVQIIGSLPSDLADNTITAIVTKYRDNPDVLAKIVEAANSYAKLQVISAANHEPKILELIKQKQQLMEKPIIEKPITEKPVTTEQIQNSGKFLDGKFVTDSGVSQWCDSYLLQLPNASLENNALLREAIQDYIQKVGIVDEACVYVYSDNGTVLCIYIQQAQIKAIEALLARSDCDLIGIIKKIKPVDNKISYVDIEHILQNSYSQTYAPNILQLDSEVKAASRDTFVGLVQKNQDLSDYALRLLALKDRRNENLHLAILKHKNAGILTCTYIAKTTQSQDILNTIAEQHIKASHDGLAILMSMLANNVLLDSDLCLSIFRTLAAQQVLSDYFVYNCITKVFEFRDLEENFEFRIRVVLSSLVEINTISVNILKFIAQRYLTLPYDYLSESAICEHIFKNEKIQPDDQEVIEIVINIAKRISNNVGSELIATIINKYKNYPDILEQIATVTKSDTMKNAIQQLKFPK